MHTNQRERTGARTNPRIQACARANARAAQAGSSSLAAGDGRGGPFRLLPGPSLPPPGACDREVLVGGGMCAILSAVSAAVSAAISAAVSAAPSEVAASAALAARQARRPQGAGLARQTLRPRKGRDALRAGSADPVLRSLKMGRCAEFLSVA